MLDVTWNRVSPRRRWSGASPRSRRRSLGAERELQRLADAAEHGTDAVVSVDVRARVHHWNRGAERLYGFRFEEVVGRSLHDLDALTEQPGAGIAGPGFEPHDGIDRMLPGQAAYQYEARRRAEMAPKSTCS